MGILYKQRYEMESGKNYLVLRPILFTLYILLFLLLLAFSIAIFKAFYIKILGNYFISFTFTILGLFAVFVLILIFERRKALFARFKKKEVKIKGGTTIFNVNNPPELWIEQ